MTLKIKTPPTVEPVSLTEAKLHLRVEHTDEDTLISNLISAAREHAESFQNRAFITRTYDLFLDNWPSRSFTLPQGPIQEILSIGYFNENGEEGQVDPGAYSLDSEGHIYLKSGKSWPNIVTLQEKDGVKISYKAGISDDADNIPRYIKQAMLLMIAHWYAYREAVSEKSLYEVPLGAYLLLGVDRVWPI